MVLRNFDLLWKKLWYYRHYGTMAKTMVLYRELLNINLQNKKHDRSPKTMKVWFIMGTNLDYNILKQLKFSHKYIALELRFTMKKKTATMKTTIVLK